MSVDDFPRMDKPSSCKSLANFLPPGALSVWDIYSIQESFKFPVDFCFLLGVVSVLKSMWSFSKCFLIFTGFGHQLSMLQVLSGRIWKRCFLYFQNVKFLLFLSCFLSTLWNLFFFLYLKCLFIAEFNWEQSIDGSEKHKNSWTATKKERKQGITLKIIIIDIYYERGLKNDTWAIIFEIFLTWLCTQNLHHFKCCRWPMKT